MTQKGESVSHLNEFYSKETPLIIRISFVDSPYFPPFRKEGRCPPLPPPPPPFPSPVTQTSKKGEGTPVFKVGREKGKKEEAEKEKTWLETSEFSDENSLLFLLDSLISVL